MDTQPKPERPSIRERIEQRRIERFYDAINDALTVGNYWRDGDSVEDADITRAVLDAIAVEQPDAVAEWYAEHHPQPERGAEQQRDDLAHAYAVGVAHAQSIWVDSEHFRNSYEWAFGHIDRVLDAFAVEHAAARKRHTHTDPERV